MTWKEIKLATLQKMFSSNGETIQMDSSNQEYLYAMPQQANEALQMLATAGKFIIKDIEIVNRPIDNILGNGFQNYHLIHNGVSFTAPGLSYYFEAQGRLTLTIEIEGVETVVDINPEGSTGYVIHKGHIDNPDKKNVTLTFYAEYEANLKNVCMYEYSFEDDDHVPQYREFMRYRMKDVAEDFYQFKAAELYKDDEDGYEVADDFYQEADQTFVVERKNKGVYRIYYRAYPVRITRETEDDYELPLDPEVAVLLPLYMASQGYKDDDNSIATVYRNEFEVAFDRLMNGTTMRRKEEFTSLTGW